MRKPSPLTWMLILLVLLPSGVLAWLGLRSADAFDASERTSLRVTAEADREAWLARAQELADRVVGRLQQALAKHAEPMAAELPSLTPEAIAQRLRATAAQLAKAGVDVRDVRLVDATGRTIFPVAHQPEGATRPASTPTRAGLLAHLKRQADLAYYGDGGEDAAVAVWTRASESASSAALRTLFDVETALVRARQGPHVARVEAARLDNVWSEGQLVALGRPTVLLWLAASWFGRDSEMIHGVHHRDSRYVGRLHKLDEDGILDATPLTTVERGRLRLLLATSDRTGSAGNDYPSINPADSGWTADRWISKQTRELEARLRRGGGGAVELSTPLPGGTRLVAGVTRASLYEQLLARAAELMPVRMAHRRVYVWIEGLRRGRSAFAHRRDRETLTKEREAFRSAAQADTVVPLTGDVSAHVHLTLKRWVAAYDYSHERHYWTRMGIGLLLLVTTLGLVLVRLAVTREREARRIRDDFIANVTHEVRTPLTSVLLHAEMLIEDGVSEPQRRAHAEVVQAQGKRLAALVGDMLDFAALGRGTRTLEATPVDLAAACREAIAPYRVLAEREGADVLFEEPGREVAAMADPAALARILANLVGNAWKHGRPSRDGHPGRLALIAREDARGGVVEVRDDGPGIPSDERAQVFERFGRGRGAASKEGSGIGLALARDLARAMGGDLDIHEEGAWTVFRLRVPPVPAMEEL